MLFLMYLEEGRGQRGLCMHYQAYIVMSPLHIKISIQRISMSLQTGNQNGGENQPIRSNDHAHTLGVVINLICQFSHQF